MIYIYTYMASIFFAYLAERSKDKGIIILCSAISILIPSVLGGLRHYTVGTDSAGYGIALSNLALRSSGFIDYFTHYYTEPGCSVLFYFGTKLFGSYNGAFFLFEIVTITCFYIGAYRYRHSIPLTMIMLVFLFMLYNRTYNEIRQSVAAVIIFMGVIYLERKQYIKFSLHIVIATLFHYSAVMTFFTFVAFHAFTTSKRYDRDLAFRFITILGIIVFLISSSTILKFLLNSVSFLQHYNSYADMMARQSGGLPKLLGQYLAELLVLLFYHQGSRRVFAKNTGEHNNNFYEFLLIFSISFMTTVTYYDRFFFYTDYLNVLIVASFPFVVREKTLRMIFFFATIIALVAFWYFKFLVSTAFRTWPYRSIL